MKRKIATVLFFLLTATAMRADRLDDFVTDQMKKQHVPGVVVVVLQNGAVVEQRAYGLANIEFNVRMKIEDVFTVDSITGLFTTTAVFELVQDGKLRLEDRLTALLPGLPDTWNDISIMNCLSHTSGLPDLFDDDHTLPIAFDPHEAIQKLAVKPINFKPGEKSKFNQTEFLLLRMVIERISGETFEEFMTERVFKPAGLRTAQFADARDIVPEKATLYSHFAPDASRRGFQERDGVSVRSDRQMWVFPFYYPQSVRAGAGLVMNALDLARFDAALSTKTLLNARTLEAMWAPVKLSNGEIGDYTTGWRRWGKEPNTLQVIVGQSGGSGVEYIRTTNGLYSVIVLTNCPDAAVHVLTMGILGLYSAPTLVAHPDR